MTVTSPTLPLRLYDEATRLLPLTAKRHIRKRISIDKEDPERWTERFGQPSAPRPAGKLIWIHAVGLGEVLSLRGLAAQMVEHADVHILITSGTKAAARALAQNMPSRTIHQYLPLDAPQYRRAFLDHWQPDLCVWAEQDIWPGFVLDLSQRKIPQAHIVCRMHAKSWRNKSRFEATYRYIYGQMALVTAYDQQSQEFLRSFGISDAPITGSIKPAAPALTCDPNELVQMQEILGSRFVWIAAPTHPADEALALAAHERVLTERPDALLIIAPRHPKRDFDLKLPHATRSKGERPSASDQVYLADSFGDLGLLYRLSQAALIGGTNDATEGHSPWEAAILNNAILHGPRTANFQADFDTLDAAGAAIKVTTAHDIAHALTTDLQDQIARAKTLIAGYRNATDTLAKQLVALT